MATTNHEHHQPTKIPLKDYILTLPQTQRQLVQEVKQRANDLQVWRAFHSKESLFIASDGGIVENQPKELLGG